MNILKGRNVLIIGIIGTIAFLLALTTMETHINNPLTSLGAQNSNDQSIRIAYIAANPDPTVEKLESVQEILHITTNKTYTSVPSNALIAIDLRNATTNYIHAVKPIFNEAVHKNKPIILIGSPSTIKRFIGKSIKAYAIPIYIAKGNNPSKLQYSRIPMIIFAYIPPTISRPWPVFVSSIIKQDKELTRGLHEVISKVIRYTLQGSNGIRLAYTLPSQNAVLLAQADASYNCSPYGKINARDAIYQVLDDGNPNYNWFIYRFIDQIIPGEQLWGNGWRNNKLIQEIDADYNDPTGFLSYYKPSTYVGEEVKTETITLTITGGKDKDGVSVGGSITIGYSWSYAKPDIVIIDRSDYDVNMAKWENRINKDKIVGSSTVQLEPGAIIRYPEDGQQHHFKTEYTGQWAKKHCRLFGHLCSWSYSNYYALVIEWILNP